MLKYIKLNLIAQESHLSPAIAAANKLFTLSDGLIKMHRKPVLEFVPSMYSLTYLAGPRGFSMPRDYRRPFEPRTIWLKARCSF